MKKILVTGGCGFIGSNFVRHMMGTHPDVAIVNLDKLTYAGNLNNLRDLEDDPHYNFVLGDIAEFDDVWKAMEGAAYVVHFAAETHVDRSIKDASAFVRTNVLGTYHLLEAAMRAQVKRFIHVSTDEVYGTLGHSGYFLETSPLMPNSPYSASKAGSDCLVRSYYETYKFPAIITRCSNNYGPYQYPEKLIPLMINNALANKKLPVYGDGLNVRDWLYVENHCRAIDVVLQKGRLGEIYNIGGSNEWRNIDLVKLLLKKLRKPESLIEFVEDRLGHDRRYAIDSHKIQDELGWRPSVDFEKGLDRTIQWYVEHEDWLQKLKEREFKVNEVMEVKKVMEVTEVDA